LTAAYHNKALPEGTVLGEWRLQQVLGAGGFGIVYRGNHIYFDETVAIKEYFPGAISDRLDGTTVAPTDSSSEEVYELGRKKFLEEAKILWNLSRPERHPNIVSVRSLFETHGTAYMVMDFENGVSLSQMLKEGKRFEEKSLLALILPIAQGLERAHRAGVLHRDIKPANILVNEAGKPVLIDFGSARFDSSQATNTKLTFYTPPYAAIEQYVKSYPQGPWTDIYALGVVLYQCVSGEKPPEVLERLHGGLGQSLSDREWPGFSRTFTRAVDAAMGIRPLERPQTISAWLKLFTEAADTEVTRVAARIANDPMAMAAPVLPAPPEPVKPVAQQKSVQTAEKAPRKKPLLLGLGLSAAASLGIAAYAFWPSHPAPVQPTPVISAVAQAPEQAAPSLDKQISALTDTATKLGRPREEIADLTKAGTALAAAPAGTPQNSLAAAMARKETDILSRAEKRLWKDMEQPLDAGASDPSNAIAALGRAKTDLEARFAPSPANADAAQAIANTQQTLELFGKFQDAYKTALPVFVAGRREQFGALYSSLQSQAEKIAALAAVDKPWFLASQARKQAYALRQDNAAQAKSLMAQMSGLPGTVAASNDLKQLNAALDQLKAAQPTLSGLYEAANAAKL
jgi:serine/threonine protein kinase